MRICGLFYMLLTLCKACFPALRYMKRVKISASMGKVVCLKQNLF
jgi:hypothetical protein